MATLYPLLLYFTPLRSTLLCTAHGTAKLGQTANDSHHLGMYTHNSF